MNPAYPPPPPPGSGWPPPGPGYGYGYGGPPPKTTTPRTLGTLSMVFGGIVTGTSLLGLLLGGQLGTFGMRSSQKAAFDHYLAEIHTFTIVQSVIMLGMSIALFYIGTGQRSYQRWAAGASVKWGLAALAVIVFNTIGVFTVVMPALDAFIADITHGGFNTAPMVTGMKVGAVMGIAFNLPYPIIMITAFRKPVNVAAMDQPPLLPTASIHKA